MASFLDKAGLTKFWENVKQYIEVLVDTSISNIHFPTPPKTVYPLNFSIDIYGNQQYTITYGGKNNPNLSSNNLFGNILIWLFFNKLFYLFDVTDKNPQLIFISEVLKYIGIYQNRDNKNIYLGRIYKDSNSYLNGDFDVYVNYYQNHSTINISLIPVIGYKALFSNGEYNLLMINYTSNDKIQDPIIPELTFSDLKGNGLDNYIPYLKNMSSEVKFKIEYANFIRDLLKIYIRRAGSNELELIGKDNPNNSKGYKYITPEEIVTTYLNPGDKLYMYGTLSYTADNYSKQVGNIYKLLPSLPGADNKYVINITPCNAEGNTLDNIDLDQHYLEYGGNIRGIFGYPINDVTYNNSYSSDIKLSPWNTNILIHFLRSKYIREIIPNQSMNYFNFPHSLEFDVIKEGDKSIIPLYHTAFVKTSVKKGYISLRLYSSKYKIVDVLTNFKETYEGDSLTELDVSVDWYDNSKLFDYNDVKYTKQVDNLYLESIAVSIINNVRGCKNLRKITLKYPGDVHYADKIKFLLNEVKAYILNNPLNTALHFYHKAEMDNTIDYTIDIQAI